MPDFAVIVIKKFSKIDDWNFCDALRRKFLCFFPLKNYEFINKVWKRKTLKRIWVETWNLHLSWGTYESFFVLILGAIGHAIRVSESKTEMSILGLNSSSSKTNRTRGIKVSNLEASGHALSALKNKPWRFRHFFLSFFLSLFIYGNFRDALHRKSLCFFREKLRIHKQSLKTL